MQQLIHDIWHNDSGASTPDSVGPDSSDVSISDTDDEDECCAHNHTLLGPISPLPTAVRARPRLTQVVAKAATPCITS